MKIHRTVFFFLMLSVVGCSESQTDHSGQVKEELRQREVVHLTPGQITERALQLGDTMIEKAEFDLSTQLKSKPGSSCVSLFAEISSELNRAYGAQLTRMPFDPKRVQGITSKKEKELVDAYFYSHENNLPIEPNLQADGDKDFLFTRALVIKDKNCLSCHQTHSNPLLLGAMGDTLGIWDLRFKKKQVVMSFVD